MKSFNLSQYVDGLVIAFIVHIYDPCTRYNTVCGRCPSTKRRMNDEKYNNNNNKKGEQSLYGANAYIHVYMSYAIDQRIPSLVSLPSIIIQPSIFFVWFFAIYILIDNPNIDSNIYTETETNTK